jgi:hypothetical protein
MATDELLSDIESPDFVAFTQLAASLEAFIRYTQSQESFLALRVACRRDSDTRLMVLSRLGELATANSEEGVIPDSDVPVAAYALALRSLTDDESDAASSLALGSKGWWAPLMGRYLLETAAAERASFDTADAVLSITSLGETLSKHLSTTTLMGANIKLPWRNVAKGRVDTRQVPADVPKETRSSLTNTSQTVLTGVAS